MRANFGTRDDDIFKRRLRLLVKDVVSGDQLVEFPISGVSYLLKHERHVLFRIGWFLTILSCFGLCGYQGIERLQYYLSYPVAMDVHIEQDENLTLPAISVCSGDPEIVANRLLKQEWLHPTYPRHCYLRLQAMFEHLLSHNVTPFWNSYLNDPPNWVMPLIRGIKGVSFAEEAFINELGFCKTIKISTNLRFRGHVRPLQLKIKSTSHCPGPRAVMIAIHDKTEKPLLKEFYNYDQISDAEYSVESRKYVFQRRPGHDCVNEETFSNCIAGCYGPALTEELSCRHPFLPSTINLTLCKDIRGFMNSYNFVLHTVANGTKFSSCSCRRRCIQNNFHIMPNIRSSNTYAEVSGKVLRFVHQNNYVISLTERFAYTVLSLLCDIGGNLGLYLGLSILSLFELFHIIIKSERRRKKSMFILKDSLYQKVKAIHKATARYKGEGANRLKDTLGIANIEKQDSTLVKVLWSLVLLFNFVGCLYLILNRSIFYYQAPTTTVVDVEGNGLIQYPRLIMCYETEKIAEGKRKYARKHNLTSRCSIHFLDLLDVGINATHLWNISYDSDLAYGITTPIITPYGTCAETDYGIQAHFGKNIGRPLYIYRMDICYEVQQLFVVSPGESFDFTNYRHIPANGDIVYISFTVKEYNVILTTPDCFSTEAAKTCEEQCLQSRLSESNLKCQLPYMLNIGLPECDSPSTAKQAMDTYLGVSMETNPVKHCSCRRQCIKMIYDSRIIIIPADFTNSKTNASFGVPRALLVFESAYREVISEIPAYSFIKLLCDVGGNLGLALGLSLLTIFDIFVIVLQSLTATYFSNTK